MKKDKRIYLYDSTLRDGAQARGVDFSMSDKLAIAKLLDEFGIDYIEGGFAGANPKDDEFFAKPPKLKNTKLTAFGMTHKVGRSAENDSALNTLVDANAKSLCIVGKTWDMQVEKALGISLAQNLKIIDSSISYLKKRGVKEIMFDAEHFFDGYKANKIYAIDSLCAAQNAGADWLILCDTNGGSMPDEIFEIVSEVRAELPDAKLGIHCHNDTEQAVANSLAAVRAGATQVQGTINGIGERCGNANLISVLANLVLKMGYETGVDKKNMERLVYVSRFVDERLNRTPNAHAAYVGAAAFAHKGGLHASAIAKYSSSYEHVAPHKIGNEREVLVSDKAGKSNILAKLKSLGVRIKEDDERLPKLLAEIKRRELYGYAYESASASFEILVKSFLGKLPEFFELLRFRVTDERRFNARGSLVTISEASVKVKIDKDEILSVGEGVGPVNALDMALRGALEKHYKQIKDVALIDYKVRILNPESATEAVTRVMIESKNTKTGESWCTIGVSENIVDASYKAYRDAVIFCLLKS